jgi:hypothetical protein
MKSTSSSAEQERPERRARRKSTIILKHSWYAEIGIEVSTMHGDGALVH